MGNFYILLNLMLSWQYYTVLLCILIMYYTNEKKNEGAESTISEFLRLRYIDIVFAVHTCQLEVKSPLFAICYILV